VTKKKCSLFISLVCIKCAEVFLRDFARQVNARRRDISEQAPTRQLASSKKKREPRKYRVRGSNQQDSESESEFSADEEFGSDDTDNSMTDGETSCSSESEDDTGVSVPVTHPVPLLPKPSLQPPSVAPTKSVSSKPSLQAQSPKPSLQPPSIPGPNVTTRRQANWIEPAFNSYVDYFFPELCNCGGAKIEDWNALHHPETWATCLCGAWYRAKVGKKLKSPPDTWNLYFEKDHKYGSYAFGDGTRWRKSILQQPTPATQPPTQPPNSSKLKKPDKDTK